MIFHGTFEYFTSISLVVKNEVQALLMCIWRVTGDTLLKAVDMMPALVQSVEKAVNQPTQPALVTEAVSAANILVKLSLVDINAGKYFNTLPQIC